MTVSIRQWIKRRPLSAPACLLILLTASACDTKTIADIKADPYKYENEEVRIAGVVTGQFAILNYGIYELEDPTGKILVVSERGIPSRNTRVEVKGNTMTGFSLAGVDYGTVFREKSREVKN